MADVTAIFRGSPGPDPEINIVAASGSIHRPPDSMNTIQSSTHGADYSWGAYDHYAGSSPDTALAIEVITRRGPVTYDKLSEGLTFILNQQNSHGGWPYVKTDVTTPPSQILPTAQNLVLLNLHKSRPQIQTSLTNGIRWLKLQQKASSGGFGAGADGTVNETAAAYQALNAALGGTDAAAVAAQNFLLARQNSDGSWGGTDPLSTSQSLNTLPASSGLDTDRDGVPDGVEILLGTNPAVNDSHTLAKGNGRSVVGVTAPQLRATAYLGQAFSYTLTAAGGSPPLMWSVVAGALPDGLVLDALTGVISGTPSRLGTYSFSYEQRDSASQTIQRIGQIVVVKASPASAHQVPALPVWANALLAVLLLAMTRRAGRVPCGGVKRLTQSAIPHLTRR